MGRSRDANLLPLFRSDAQAKILAAIFLAPEDAPANVRAIAKMTGLPYSTVHREISRLEQARLVESTQAGRSRVIHPNRASPYYHELRSLLLKSYGPAGVLGEILQSRAGVKDAYIYGSWASRYSGEPGSDPQDIDLVVILDSGADRATIEDDLVAAGDQLGRQVNPILVDELDWAEAASPFLRTIRGRPLVRIPLTTEDDVDR